MIRRRRAALGLLLVVWGMQAVVFQSMLVREALVLTHGSELALGLVFSVWLLGVALGAGTAGLLGKGHIVQRHAGSFLLIALLALGVVMGAELWWFRGARLWFALPAGVPMALPQTALAALIGVGPVGVCVGWVFPLACLVRRETTDLGAETGIFPFGTVYALEAGGSLVGGALFSFLLVEQLHAVQVVLLGLAATSAAGCCWLATSRRPVGSVVLAVLAVLVAGVAVHGAEALHGTLLHRRWAGIAPGAEVVAEIDSKHQNLAVTRRLDQYTLYADGRVVLDFPDPYSCVPLVHFQLCQHPAPRSVLLIGGAEGLLAEVLRHPVERVDCVMADPRALDILTPFLPVADRKALRDPRAHVHHRDARHFIKTQRAQYDLVIAHWPEPISASRARYFTAEFYAELRRTLTDRAVVCFQAATPPGELTALSRDYLASLRATLSRSFPERIVSWGEPAQVLAATAPDLLTTDGDVLASRYAARGVTSPWFNPVWFDGAVDWLDADKLASRTADLDAVSSPSISTDARPVVFMQRLALWEALIGGADGPQTGFVEQLRAVRLSHAVTVLAALGAMVLFAERLRRREPAGWSRGALTLSVGSTGFVTMAQSIVLLFMFQSLYGYVYARLAWLVALFMAGLVAGCMLVRSRRDPPGWPGMIAVDIALALLSVALPLAFAGMRSPDLPPVAVEAVCSVLMVASGLLGGAAFAIAAPLSSSLGGGRASAAGHVVGADHFGASIGALMCGVLLVPVFGITAAALLLAGVKIASAFLIAATKRCVAMPAA